MKIPPLLRLPLASLPLAVLALGCASYQLGTVHNPGFKTIFIENFKSDIDEPLLENITTTTVIQQFQKDGTIRVTDEQSADVILRAHITTFEMSPVRFSRENELTPTQVTMTMGIKYTLTRRGETKPYTSGSASGDSSFFIGNDLQSDKRIGVPLAAAKLGQSLVASLTEGW